MLLIAARMLVRFVPLARWKGLLGDSQTPENSANRDAADANGNTELTVRQCVAAIRRGSFRLPGTICLPQAIGLQWMLARRGISSTVTIGFMPVSRRGDADDLHAWVDWNGHKILGDRGENYASLLQFRKNFRSRNCKSGTV